jgi:hypothetical protein
MLKTIFYILAFASVFAFGNLNAKKLDDVFEEVIKLKQSSNSETCQFFDGDGIKKLGISSKNARLQITNKISGKSEYINFEVGTVQNYDTLKIRPLKCCMVEERESYSFLAIQNSKIKKEVFRGWMLSHASSINPFEDAKFDIILVKCF